MRLIIACLAAAVVVGCTQTPTTSMKQHVVDENYVAMIEKAAEDNSSRVEVIWVNPPTQVVAKTDNMKP
ncbi:MAG TPA: hypothetical protein VFM61_08390 [Pseudidiomarina sp.]|nr:hypothetical protein [Pseudidiomarina sp.]